MWEVRVIILARPAPRTAGDEDVIDDEEEEAPKSVPKHFRIYFGKHQRVQILQGHSLTVQLEEDDKPLYSVPDGAGKKRLFTWEPLLMTWSNNDVILRREE
jgi:hypothetical protein